MSLSKAHLEINKANWNKRTLLHTQSDFYNNQKFIEGATSLKAPELALLGDIKGKTILHLQCHFGQDSISLSRMGAKVTGIDLSNIAIDFANNLAKTCTMDTEFICCNIYDLKAHLDKKFDIVFTSYGTIGWLPDINKWAEIVSHFLSPNGRLIFVEFHPLIWALDEKLQHFKYDYFNGEAIIEKEEGSYADSSSKEIIESVGWNHGLAEVVQSLIGQGLRIEHLKEYNYSAYPIFHNNIERTKGEFVVKHIETGLPFMYSIVAKL